MARVGPQLLPPSFLIVVTLIANVLGNIIFQKNLAYMKTAWQSTVGNGGVPSRAIDGNTTTNWIGGSCTATAQGDPAPWWMVDLGTSYNVTHVIISNRGDCCGEKLHDFSIELFSLNPTTSGKGGNAKSNLCAHQTGTVNDGFTIKYVCAAGSTGRYLRIMKKIIQSPNDTLTLCEVHVVGSAYTPTCPDGFLTEGNICYYHSTNASTWRDALKDCQSTDSNLALPTSKDQNDMMASKLKVNGSAGAMYWVGAREQSSTGGWNTVDASHESLDYMNWEHEQKTCVVMSEPAQFKWEIKPCTNIYHYICSRKM